MRSTGESTAPFRPTPSHVERWSGTPSVPGARLRGVGELAGTKTTKHPLTRPPARRDDDGFVVEREAKHFFKCTGIGDAELDYSWAEMLRCADTNKDGRISREEFNAYIMADAEVMRDGTFKDKLIERNLVNE